MTATAARRAALLAMRAVRGGAFADEALDDAAALLDARDRAWVHELVYGTVRLRGRIDHRLAALSTRPLARLDPDILDILRLGAYQLIEMGGVPAYAAVSESVELAKQARRGAAGYVNGVLQSLRRAPHASTFPSPEDDPVGYLSTWGSHPRWLVERWVDRFGAADTSRLVSANNSRPELYLSVLAGDVAHAAARLRERGVATEPVPFASRSLRVTAGTAAAAVAAAPVIVQDPAASLVVAFVGPVCGVLVDLAAAPGGKALALAADAAANDDAVFVAAADRSVRRVQRLAGNLARLRRAAPAGLGTLPLVVVAADGRAPPFRMADTVLLDAPCTGTGTLRRHPDGRWRLSPHTLRSLVRLQRELIDAAAALVRPGGLLVYATCSLEPEENEAQVHGLLERHDAFELEPGCVTDATMVDAAGMLRVLPQHTGVDGAFAARLRRRTGEAGR